MNYLLRPGLLLTVILVFLTMHYRLHNNQCRHCHRKTSTDSNLRILPAAYGHHNLAGVLAAISIRDLHADSTPAEQSIRNYTCSMCSLLASTYAASVYLESFLLVESSSFPLVLVIPFI